MEIETDYSLNVQYHFRGKRGWGGVGEERVSPGLNACGSGVVMACSVIAWPSKTLSDDDMASSNCA